MMRPALVDVNVLLPLLLPQHPAHAAARQWLGLQAKNTTRYALPVQLVLRFTKLLTNEIDGFVRQTRRKPQP